LIKTVKNIQFKPFLKIADFEMKLITINANSNIHLSISAAHYLPTCLAFRPKLPEAFLFDCICYNERFKF